MTVCVLGGGHEIEGVALNSPIYGGPACITHVLEALSIAALTPASQHDRDNYDRRQDARADSLTDDPNYSVLPEDLIDLQDVAGGALAGSSLAPMPRPSAASSSQRSVVASHQDDSSPAGSSRRAA